MKHASNSELKNSSEEKDNFPLVVNKIFKNIEKARKSANTRKRANVRESILIRIPDVDRSKADNRNNIAVIRPTQNEKLYNLGTKYSYVKEI